MNLNARPTIAKAVVSVVSGILSHVCLFKRGEWHTRSTSLILLWSAAISIILAYKAVISSESCWTEFCHTFVYIALYHVSLLSSVLIYRVFWHPLRHFPGPPAASLSKLWHVYHNLSCQNHLLLDELYQQFGPFVRTGMLCDYGSSRLTFD